MDKFRVEFMTGWDGARWTTRRKQLMWTTSITPNHARASNSAIQSDRKFSQRVQCNVDMGVWSSVLQLHTVPVPCMIMPVLCWTIVESIVNSTSTKWSAALTYLLAAMADCWSILTCDRQVLDDQSWAHPKKITISLGKSNSKSI